MSETSLGRGAPGGVPAEELARRQVRDERGAGQGLDGALLKGCLDRGIEPVFLPSHQFVGRRSVEEQLEFFYAQYARRVAPLFARQGQ